MSTLHQPTHIELRGVRVNNLQGIDVDIPLGKITAITGISGSGKSSLAFDTLYTEGQRRYIESFSATARQHLDRLEKPNAERIDHLPPAVALRQNSVPRSPLATVGTVSGIDDCLRLLFARLGSLVCPDCNQAVQKQTPTDVVAAATCLKDGTRFQTGFEIPSDSESSRDNRLDSMTQMCSELAAEGFVRAIVLQGEKAEAINLADVPSRKFDRNRSEIIVVVDRLVSGKTSASRLRESIETCWNRGHGECILLASGSDASSTTVTMENRPWSLHRFSDRLNCPSCGKRFQEAQPSLLSFQSPLGACSGCEGKGRVARVDFDRLVPDPSRSLQADALSMFEDARWSTDREQLMSFAEAAGIRVDCPFHELSESERQLLESGSAEFAWNGVRGFFAQLERRRQSQSLREFLSRWRSIEDCPACQGTRLAPQARAVRLPAPKPVHGEVDERSVSRSLSIIEASVMPVDELGAWLAGIRTAFDERAPALLDTTQQRIELLVNLGLGYLSCSRSMNSLASGEARRVLLASIAGSHLVNSLFVLDEPSAGLHPADTARLCQVVTRIRDNGNTVVLVEHDPMLVQTADHVIDLGPGAGGDGGRVVFAGPLSELHACRDSETARYLEQRQRSFTGAAQEERKPTGEIRLRGVQHRSLQNLDVEFPLGCLCVVTGVSGAGKRLLVEETLYPAMCNAMELPHAIATPGQFREVSGHESISEIQLVTDEPLSANRRSSPVTWLKIFGEIRKLFAATPEAARRELTAAHFSFNTASGGRCPKCSGTGTVEIDMHFLADVSMVCPECHGSRFRRAILEVTWRGRSIADVLAMTAAQAFSFFRGESSIQKRLQSLKNVGLDYLTLGRPLATLSGGESQRLKLAACLASTTRQRSLLLLNEPSRGLHPHDVERLLDCFRQLLAVGHSLIVIEHDPAIIRAADHIIEVGPGAGPNGGRIIAFQPPSSA